MLSQQYVTVVIAYILEGLVSNITKLGVPRFVAFLISYTLFVTAVALILFGLVPLVISQVSQLVTDFPEILNMLTEIGYDGYLSFECLPKPDVDRVLQDSLSYVNKLLIKRPV